MLKQSLVVIAVLVVGCHSLSKEEAEQLVKQEVPAYAEYKSSLYVGETTRDNNGWYDTTIPWRSKCAEALSKAKVASVVPRMTAGGNSERLQILPKGKLRLGFLHIQCGDRIVDGIESITTINSRTAKVRYHQHEIPEPACDEITQECPTILPKYHPGSWEGLMLFELADDGKWRKVDGDG